MATPAPWPSALAGVTGTPLPDYLLREGYGYQQRSMAASTNFGLVTLTRRLYADAPVDFEQVVWLMTGPQKSYFEAWFHQVLDGGVRPVLLPLLVSGSPVLREVSFEGRVPSMQLVGARHWRVIGALTTAAGLQPSLTSFEGLGAFEDFLFS